MSNDLFRSNQVIFLQLVSSTCVSEAFYDLLYVFTVLFINRICKLMFLVESKLNYEVV